jgi:hypothetical protein
MMKVLGVFAISSVMSSIDPGCGALGTHFFCDDFDDGPFPGAFNVTSTSGGSVTLDSAKSVSGGHSLLAATLRSTTSTRTFARLERPFATAGKHFTLAFSEWVPPERARVRRPRRAVRRAVALREVRRPRSAHDGDRAGLLRPAD